MITLAEARERIGDGVTYQAPHGDPGHRWDPEAGIVTSVNDRFVFVRYQRSGGVAATDPADLEWWTP